MFIAGALLTAIGYVASTPLLTAIGGQLVDEDPPQRVDAIIVLAPWLDRVLEAGELYRAGYAPLVLLTREVRQPAEQLLIDRGIIAGTEEIRRDVLVKLGVPREKVVILDGFVGSTADEARRFGEWARRHPIAAVMVVTSPQHTGRARLTFERALQRLNVRVVMRASRMTRFRRSDWWQARDTLRDGVLELQRLIYYRAIELWRVVPIAPASTVAES
jgi:uncharacterized SAM-binding protein YcdF (DUF218 family)